MSDTTIMRKCDFCGKTVDRWDISAVKKIQYRPGERYKRCSSDIRSSTELLTRLCPDCMGKLERLIYKHKKEK